MGVVDYEIRVCLTCGLRYPLVGGARFGVRCPGCLGETRLLINNMHHGEKVEKSGRIEVHTLGLHILLDNVRSAFNAGSILRTAEGFGFQHAYFCGISPTPEIEAVKKTSLGAEEIVTWSYHKDAVKLVTRLKKQGWEVLALEESKKSIDIHGVLPTNKNRAIIVGNEITGIDPDLLTLSHHIPQIPMLGRKRSFNVAVAFGIAAYILGNISKRSTAINPAPQ